VCYTAKWGEEDVEANIMFEKKNFWVRKMKKIRSTDDEHISKKLFLFFSNAIP
jgi:hypothetical protein